MKQREVELALKKQLLQLRIQVQRRQALAVLETVETALKPVDRLQEGLDWLRGRGLMVGLVGVAVLAYRPRFALRWLVRGWRGWRLWRSTRSGLESLIGRIVGQR